MAIAKIVEQTNGGGVKRRTILIQTDADISVTTTPVSAGTIASDLALKKTLKTRGHALDSTKNEAAAFLHICAAAKADGAGVFTVYLWATVAVTLTANSFVSLEIEEVERINND